MLKNVKNIIHKTQYMGGKMWENARFIVADIPIDKTKAKKILPVGMGLYSPPKATIFISDYTKTSFTVPYHEAAFLIHVRTPVGKGLHCCWMIVDDDTALIYGSQENVSINGKHMP